LALLISSPAQQLFCTGSLSLVSFFFCLAPSRELGSCSLCSRFFSTPGAPQFLLQFHSPDHVRTLFSSIVLASDKRSARPVFSAPGSVDWPSVFSGCWMFHSLVLLSSRFELGVYAKPVHRCAAQAAGTDQSWFPVLRW
jgi:hypothetical protein